MEPSPSRISRRGFVALCGAAAAIAASGANEDARAAFQALCERLTGFPRMALPADFAEQLRQALIEAGHADALEVLLREDATSDAALESEIIAACYSGVLPARVGNQPVVGTLYGALVWQAADFAAPPAMCAGDWTRPPAGALAEP